MQLRWTPTDGRLQYFTAHRVWGECCRSKAKSGVQLCMDKKGIQPTILVAVGFSFALDQRSGSTLMIMWFSSTTVPLVLLWTQYPWYCTQHCCSKDEQVLVCTLLYDIQRLSLPKHYGEYSNSEEQIRKATVSHGTHDDSTDLHQRVTKRVK